MKENEAITILKAEIVHHPECSVFAEALDLAIQALEEVQQYREIGTSEELQTMKEHGGFTGVELANIVAMQMKLKEYEAIGTLEELQDMKSNYFEALSDWRQYRKIGALEECRMAREKQIPKKPILKNGESGSFVDYEDGHGKYKATKWQDWVCPICGWFVGQRYNRPQNHPHDQRKCNYCNECGQKIDWSDNN